MAQSLVIVFLVQPRVPAAPRTPGVSTGASRISGAQKLRYSVQFVS